MHRAGQVGITQRLRQIHQAVEPVLHVAVEKAAARAEVFVTRDQPEMADPVGQFAGFGQQAEQCLIGVGAHLGCQRITAITGAPGRVGRAHANHLVPRPRQAPGDLGAQPKLVIEEQPGLRRQIRQVRVCGQGAVGIGSAPDRLPTPIGDVGLAHEGGCDVGQRALARLDEIAFAPEGIARQRHAVAPCLAPYLIPVGHNPAGPEPPDHTKKIGVIRNVLIRMAQRAEDLAGHEVRVHLRQRAQRLAGADFEEHTAGLCRQSVDTGAELHAIAQLLGPVVGAGGLFRRHHRTRAVRQDGHLRGLQIKP